MNNNCWGSEKAAIIEIPIDPDEFPTPAAAVRRPDSDDGIAARGRLRAIDPESYS